MSVRRAPGLLRQHAARVAHIRGSGGDQARRLAADRLQPFLVGVMFGARLFMSPTVYGFAGSKIV